MCRKRENLIDLNACKANEPRKEPKKNEIYIN